MSGTGCLTDYLVRLALGMTYTGNEIRLCSKSLKFFQTSKNGLDYFAKIAHKIVKSKYFPNILNDSDSRINSLSDDT